MDYMKSRFLERKDGAGAGPTAIPHRTDGDLTYTAER